VEPVEMNISEDTIKIEDIDLESMEAEICQQ